MIHTPAPWKVTDGYECKIIDADGIDRVCTVNGSNDGNIQAANARLIAAAPELLEALKRCLEYFEPSMHEGFADHVRDKINKAEGK